MGSDVQERHRPQRLPRSCKRVVSYEESEDITEVGSHEEGSASVEVHLHPHLEPLESKMLSGGREDASEAQGRLLAVQGPPLRALRDLASPDGNSISYLTRDELLLQAYQLPQSQEQQRRVELLDGHPPPGIGAGHHSAAVHSSSSPASSGGCSIEVLSVPSLAIFQVPSQPPQHMDRTNGHAQHSESHSDDAPRRQQQGHASAHEHDLSPQPRLTMQNDRQHLCASQQKDVSSPSNEPDNDSRCQHDSAPGRGPMFTSPPETARQPSLSVNESEQFKSALPGVGLTTRGLPEHMPQPSISDNQGRHSQSALPELGHASEVSQPTKSANESSHAQSALPEAGQATEMQPAEGQGTGQHLTAAMEQLLANLPDIDVIASPDLSQHPHDNREQPPLPTREERNIPEQLSDQGQQMHASEEACAAHQEQPQAVLDQEAASQGPDRGDQAGHSNASEITSQPASFLFAHPTQKQLRKQKRGGVLVPVVDPAMKACKTRISPGIAAIQPDPVPPGIEAVARAVQVLSRAPHTVSISGPVQTVGAEAQAAKPAPTSITQSAHLTVPSLPKASQPATNFISELQLDLAARVLAKQPDLAQGLQQLSSVQQKGLSHSHMLLSGCQRQNNSATGASGLAPHAAAQQAFSAGSLLQSTAGPAPNEGVASPRFTHPAPAEHQTLPRAADSRANQRSRSGRSTAAALFTASTPALIAGSPQSCVAPGGQSPIMGRAGLSPHDPPALMSAMATPEYAAAALEQQLAASFQAAGGPPSTAAGSMVSLLTEEDVPLPSVPGRPISLQDSWPESDPTRPSETQRQLIAKYIDAGSIIQGQPIGTPTLQVQETAQRAATGRQGPSSEQEFQLSPLMGSPPGVGSAFGSPTPLPFSGSLPITPLAVDTPLSRLWHTPAKKRGRSSGSSERHAKSPRSESLGAGTPGSSAIGFTSPWMTASPVPLMSTPSARLSRATEYLYGVSPDGPSTLHFGPSHAQSRGQQSPVAPPSQSISPKAPGRRSASPRQKAKQQTSWLQAQCRDVAPDLELLELQQISQQLHSLLGQCGSCVQLSEQGFAPMSRSLLKLLEHLLVFPMTALLLKDAHIITPVWACSKYPQEDVAGFASYLLNQWRSLLSSSHCPQDGMSPAAASAGFSAPASASPDMAQAHMTAAALPGHASAPSVHARQQQQRQHRHKHQLPWQVASPLEISPLHLQPAQQPQAGHGQQCPEPQGFRPYSSRLTRSAALQPEQGDILKLAAVDVTSSSALSLFRSSATYLSQAAALAAAGDMPMPSSSATADAVTTYSAAWAGDMGSMPRVQSNGAQAPQPVQSFQPLQQLQSLPGVSPDQSALQAFDGAFLRQVQTAPPGQLLSHAMRSTVHPPEPQEQVLGMTQEEIQTLFPGLLQEQDLHVPGMLAPYLAGVSSPQQPEASRPNKQGANGEHHGGGARSGLSALTGASSAFVPYKERYSSERLQPPEQPGNQSLSGQGMQPASMQRAKGSCNESMCEGDHCRPQGTSMAEQGCNGRAGGPSPARCNSQSGQHCALGLQPASQQAAPSSQASGVDVNIQEAQSAPPQGCPGPSAPKAARSPRPAEASEEETVISDIPQNGGKQRRAGTAAARRKIASWKAPVREAVCLAAASGATGGKPSREGERAERRAARLAELQARSCQAAEGSAADSLAQHDSSGLDGSRGAALGLASMLQRSSRAKGQLSRAALSSRQVSREVAGALGDVIDAVDKAAASELPAQSEAVDQAAEGQGTPSQKQAESADEVMTISSGGTEAAHGSPSSGAPEVAQNSIRVTWTAEDKELYRDILRKHGRSMMHLCAAFPMKPCKAITKFYNNKKTTLGLAKILKQAGHSREIT